MMTQRNAWRDPPTVFLLGVIDERLLTECAVMYMGRNVLEGFVRRAFAPCSVTKVLFECLHYIDLRASVGGV